MLNKSKVRTPLGKYAFLVLHQQTHIQATPNLNAASQTSFIFYTLSPTEHSSAEIKICSFL